ncbi:MAG: cytochrome d ubiquinol oxidase subunit II, partial [Methylocystis sp.]|nr:cytochrome d ubiquinol oxidase subunit II [Methylocystis sp.]
KRESAVWRARWDWLFFISGLVPSLLFGVAFGNLFLGAPFHFDETLRVVYEGGLIGLLHPFALLCGLVSVAMIVMQGAAWLSLKSEGELSLRARRAGAIAALMLVLLFTAAGAWLAFGVEGYRVAGAADPAGPSNPLIKNVTREVGAWLFNYRDAPSALTAPAFGYVGALIAALAPAFGLRLLGLIASSLSVAGVILTAGISLFPFLMPSSTHPAHSLTVWDASSSKTTLGLMLLAVAFFLPIVLAYTSWVYYVLRGPVTEEAIKRGDDHYY